MIVLNQIEVQHLKLINLSLLWVQEMLILRNIKIVKWNYSPLKMLNYINVGIIVMKNKGNKYWSLIITIIIIVIINKYNWNNKNMKN